MLQHVGQVAQGIDAVRDASGDHGIEGSETFACVLVAGEQVILSVERDDTQSTLALVVV